MNPERLDQMPSFLSFILFFFSPNRTLWTLAGLMTLTAIFSMFLNIYITKINYNGIWGISHIPFSILVAGVFYIGTKFDPREEPLLNTNLTQTTNSIRFWACFGQASCLICLNAMEFYMDYSNIMNIFKAISTIIVILGTNLLKMDLIYREVGEVFSIKMLNMMILYAVIAVFYVISFLVRSNSSSDMRKILKPLLYFFSYIQLVIIAALISGIYRNVRLLVNPLQHIVVDVQREPVANTNKECFYPRPILNNSSSSSFYEQESTLIRNPDAASASYAV